MNRSRFLIRWALALAVLTLLWAMWLGELYPHLLRPLAFWFFQVVGVKTWYLSHLQYRFVNIVPFLALMAATPLLLARWQKTAVVLVVAATLFMTEHLALSWVDYLLISRPVEPGQAQLVFTPLLAAHFAFPFVLWMVFYPGIVRQLLGPVRRASLAIRRQPQC